VLEQDDSFLHREWREQRLCHKHLFSGEPPVPLRGSKYERSLMLAAEKSRKKLLPARDKRALLIKHVLCIIDEHRERSGSSLDVPQHKEHPFIERERGRHGLVPRPELDQKRPKELIQRKLWLQMAICSG
jgi:hypothetical protein